MPKSPGQRRSSPRGRRVRYSVRQDLINRHPPPVPANPSPSAALPANATWAMESLLASKVLKISANHT